MFHLEKNGYKFLAQHGIWSRADYQDISYSDGDYEEQRLAKIIASAKDISIFSSELRNQCIDWQTLYHLSSQRGNILRPFQDKLRGKVLEIGKFLRLKAVSAELRLRPAVPAIWIILRFSLNVLMIFKPMKNSTLSP